MRTATGACGRAEVVLDPSPVRRCKRALLKPSDDCIIHAYSMMNKMHPVEADIFLLEERKY